MRNSNDRRHPHATSPYPCSSNEFDTDSVDRRKHRDRRMENLTLEERQLLFSEMPSLKPPISD